MGVSSPRVLVIGVDVGDWSLVRRWTADGTLPVLASLLENGVAGPLETTAAALHVSGWPSLYTGSDVGEHGVYYTFQPEPGLQGYRRFGADSYGRPTFWRLLGEEAVRCTVFDAPYTHPESGYRGVQIFDWGCWAQYGKTRAVPRSILRGLGRAVGSYPLGVEAHDVGLEGLDGEEMARRLTDALPAKARAARWLMEEEPWDLFFVTFGETHAGTHYCWRAGDPEQPLLRELYRALDTAVGELIEAAGPEASVLVVSVDGAGPNHSGWHLLPDVLERLGLLSAGGPDAGSEGEGDPGGGEESGTEEEGAPKWDPVKALRDLLPRDFRKAVARRLPTPIRDALARRVDTAAIDWESTRAFCLPTDLEGCIRVNLRGREPRGIVEPGAEYERVLDRIEEALGELVDPASGRSAVRRVIRSDRAFPGEGRQRLPDLVVIWDPDLPLERLRSPRIGEVAGASPDGRTGTHRPPGFLLARGPAVPGTPLPEGASVLDLAPTLLALFGLEAPSHMAGSAWPEWTLGQLAEKGMGGTS